MNITPQSPNLPIATVVNPPTDSLRRENSLREVIAQPAAASQSAAEKGLASDKDRARNPGQQNEQIDFTGIRKQAEEAASSINGSNSQRQGEQSGQDSSNNSQTDAEDTATENNSESTVAGQANESSDEAQHEAEHRRAEAAQLAEAKVIRELSDRDAEVKRHENAHASVGGSTTGSPTYQYQQGPDGKRYAVGGEVSVDLSAVPGDPAATIAKMQQVHSAALAPTNPSSQDRRVAATATKMILEAQTELAAMAREKGNAEATDSEYRAGSSSTFSYEDGHDFDTLINHTLEAQEAVSPSRTDEVEERATRIESYYLKINKAYDGAPSSHFQLTA